MISFVERIMQNVVLSKHALLPAGLILLTSAAAHAATAAEGQKSSGLPQFNIDTFPSQIFWLTIAFVVLYLFFSKKTLPEISGVMERRRENVRRNLEDAETLKQEADEVLKAYEANMNEAREKARTILLKAHQDIKDQIATETNAFKAQADEHLQALEKRLAKETEATKAELADSVAEMASIAAEKIAGISVSVDKSRKVVEMIDGKSKKNKDKKAA